jgi:hypothetical protein
LSNIALIQSANAENDSKRYKENVWCEVCKMYEHENMGSNSELIVGFVSSTYCTEQNIQRGIRPSKSSDRFTRDPNISGLIALRMIVETDEPGLYGIR